MSKRSIFILLLGLVLLFISSFFLYRHFNKNKVLGVMETLPPPKKIQTARGEKVKYPHDFTIVLLGDSMTERLGNSDEIRAYLKEYYPEKSVEVLNYGYGATNILSAEERLTKTTFHSRDFQPILDIDFDLIIIESFGNNPLSEFQLEEGLQKQNETLDKIVKLIQEENPDSKIAFLATISPNKKNYALNQVDLSKEVRAKWADERISYIKNHLEYAKAKNIPYIDVFSKSLGWDKDGDLKYIDQADYIHPSPKGIILISKEIAEFIHRQNLIQN